MNRQSFFFHTINNSRLFLMRDHCEQILKEVLASQTPAARFFDDDEKSYAEQTKELCAQLCSTMNVPLTTDFGSSEVKPGSIAYHRIDGLITYRCHWYFSSIQMESDLKEAEANPAINCHMLHITSGGGEAYYLDRLSETLRSLQKPVYAFIDKVCGSAAYYIGCHGNVVKCQTSNDTIGCIGTMVRVGNWDGWYKQMGIKIIEEYATQSDLKNKKYNDLLNGKPDQFIKEELDPLADQFIQEVRSCRKKIGKLPMDHPVLRGETFMGDKALEIGLVDGIVTMEQAFAEAMELGKAYDKEHQNRILSYI